MRSLLRAGLFFATFTMVLLAFVQVSGRIALSFLDDAEPRINQLLEGAGVELHGLQGAWRYLNPGVAIDRITLPAGELRGVRLELDVLESARRNAWVLTRALVEQGTLAVEYTDGRWQLLGMPPAGEPPIDLVALLWESDQLSAELDVTAHRGDFTAQYSVSARGANRGGSHGAEVVVREPGCDGCELRLAYDVREAVPFVRPLSRRVEANARSLSLPLAVLTGLQGFEGRVEALDFWWRDDDQLGGGHLTLHATPIELQGGEPASVEIAASLSGDAGVLRGSTEALTVRAGDAELSLAEVLFEAQRGRAVAYVPAMEAEPASAVALAFTQNIDRARSWLEALNAKGAISDVHLGLVRYEAGWRTAYAARIDEGAIDAYKGAPTVRHGIAEVFGAGRHLVADIASPEAFMHLAEVFQDGWNLQEAYGRLEAWMEPGDLAIWGRNISTQLGPILAKGSFALAQPKAREDKSIALLITADRADVPTGKLLIPFKLDKELVRWLNDAPRGGDFSNIEFAYQGQVHADGAPMVRRVALTAELAGAAMKFHPDWPQVLGVDGRLVVSGVNTFVHAERARGSGIRLDGSDVAVRDNGRVVDIVLDARGDAGAMINFVRTSPLQENMQFVSEAWVGSGPLRLTGQVQVPLRKARDKTPKANLAAALSGVSLTIPEFRTQLDELKGRATFQLPHALAADSITGKFWGEPVSAAVRHDDAFVHFDVQGQLGALRTFALVGMDESPLLEGTYSYDGTLSVAVNEANTTALSVRSDLAGLRVNAPQGIGKPHDAVVDTAIDVQFAEPLIRTDFRYGTASGWLLLDGTPQLGAIGLDAPVPELGDAQTVLVSGTLPVVDINEWSGSGTSGGLALPFPWRVEDLLAQTLQLGDVALTDISLQADKGADGIAFEFNGADLVGEVMLPDVGPMDINLDLIRLPAAEDADPLGEVVAEDPLDPALAAELPEANVVIESVVLGDDPFGRWTFDLRRVDDQTVRFENLVAEVKGVQMTSPEGVLWGSAGSRFKGHMNMSDLAEVLPQWEYAPSLSSETATLYAEVGWPGSPLNVALLNLTGDLAFEAEQGRFLEMEAGGGARIMSLLNFSAIVKRLNLNFSDVVGKGISYEEIEAHIRLNEGRLTFSSPMQVSSTSSDFKIGGTVDLKSGVLDNEMVVTLPVTRGLPWYGVYVALANPLAGLGVLVGERVLRKPLQQFSSAKYSVQGTLDEPDVRFVELFSTRMSEPDAAAVPVEPESAADSG